MSRQKKILVAGGGGGNLVATLYTEIEAWDRVLNY